MKKKKHDQTKENHYRVYGINGSAELLKHKKNLIQSIDVMENSPVQKMTFFQNYLNTRSIGVRIMSKQNFLNKYQGLRTQGIVVHFTGNIARYSLPNYSSRKGDIFLLFADNIEDPQNLGQIIRSAECAGVDGLVIPKHHSAGISDTVLQVSQGAFVHLPVYIVGNIRNTLEDLKKQGFWNVALENSVQSKRWHEIDYKGKIACVVGSEGKGIRPLIIKSCDFLATIPMKGQIESLNVTAAVSAILFERNRQVHGN